MLRTSLLLLIVQLYIMQPAVAAVAVGQGGGASCFTLVSDLQRNWSSVKRHLVPISGELATASDDDFICLSPRSVEGATEARAGGVSNFRCFRHQAVRGLGFCCDASLASCAQLNPGLFPEAYQSRQPQREYEPPKSNWVRPPSDGDQWQSN